MSDDIFGGPSAMGVDWKSLYGKLLAIFPYGKELIPTRFGDSNAIRADIYNLDEGAPVSLDALIFGRALVLQMSGVDSGKAVLGRLSQGEARGGQNAPWILLDPTPEDYALARTYFQAHPARATLRAQRSAQPQQPPERPQSPQQGSQGYGEPASGYGVSGTPYSPPPTSNTGPTRSPEAPPF